ncbi:VWA domain-containing protein [Rhodococcus sp. X156]|uniref:vWA domain-containing protein n=1 Tax=Rhodococcus sp. X156 TaxID=2499145 RepID=UPI000FD78AFA|nr:VWA domain-containing protein [Rhodococcus sp. X156]
MTSRPPWLAADRPAAPHGLPGHLVSFVEALRARGIGVGPSETVDAGQVMSVLDLLDREALREGLAAALLRRPTHRRTYDSLFDLWFPAVIGDRAERPVDTELPRDEQGDIDTDAIRDLLADFLADGSAESRELMRLLAREVAEQMGRYETRSGPAYSAYQALRGISPETLLAQILEGLLGGPEGVAEASDFDSEIARRTARERIAEFRRAVEEEVRRRTAERVGKEKVAASSVPRIAEQVDFLRARSDELTELRRTVTPLARRLASRLAARRRRSRHGTIDMRRTMRKSMSTGGVPLKLEQRKPRPGRPELVILCDVSGSVAGFSHFTLLLVNALREQFSRVRIFAFVDTTDEVTPYFAGGADLAQAMTRMTHEAQLVTYDGHSDYGHALGTFAEQFGDALTQRSSLLILGDGRTNYRDPNLAVLRRLDSVAKHAYWLNPEPQSQWGSGDSAAIDYAAVVPMHECRTAEQLAAVVSRLLPV